MLRPSGSIALPFWIKKASLAFRMESRLEKIFSMGINSMSLAVWLGEDRKCSAAVRIKSFGETKRRLKDRFNEHRRTIDNPNNKSKPTTAAEHFLSSPNHTANDMLLIPIEKIFSNRDSIRKAREAFLIQKGKTIDPDGLNIREETY